VQQQRGLLERAPQTQFGLAAAVDAEAQIIVAQDVTQCAVDCAQLVPMTDAIETNLGRKPDQLSADAGYCSEANLEALENRNIDAYVATGRAKDASKARPPPQRRPAQARAHRRASRRCAPRSRPAVTEARACSNCGELRNRDTRAFPD